jgi:predicted unusual protein kinase regulating ubiquinone biosynthesis (AarF/ABC1/UbiB family)
MSLITRDFSFPANERLSLINDDSELREIQSTYNGNKISEYYLKKPLLVWERMWEIGAPVLTWWLNRKLDNITAPFRSKEENYRLLNLRATDLKEAIVQGQSVTFIKSGQALALRPDLVKSPEYVRELQKLQDEVGTFSNKVAMEIISEELGLPARDIYRFDPPDPIASASIGQVYKAYLIGEGGENKAVAVKVQVSPNTVFISNTEIIIIYYLCVEA